MLINFIPIAIVICTISFKLCVQWSIFSCVENATRTVSYVMINDLRLIVYSRLDFMYSLGTNVFAVYGLYKPSVC